MPWLVNLLLKKKTQEEEEITYKTYISDFFIF